MKDQYTVLFPVKDEDILCNLALLVLLWSVNIRGPAASTDDDSNMDNNNGEGPNFQWNNPQFVPWWKATSISIYYPSKRLEGQPYMSLCLSHW